MEAGPPPMATPPAQQPAGSAGFALAALSLVVVLVIFFACWPRPPRRSPARAPPRRAMPHLSFTPRAPPEGVPAGGPPVPWGASAPLVDARYAGQGTPSPKTPPAPPCADRLYSAADADRVTGEEVVGGGLAVGQLYRHAGNIRQVYSARSAVSDRQGLVEFSSGGGGAGDLGYDVGPFGFEPHGSPPVGTPLGHDDGIPENYSFPSTPVRWYVPRMRDHYGAGGPTAFSEGLYATYVPDHDPLVGSS